jgi:hypothetical protein
MIIGIEYVCGHKRLVGNTMTFAELKAAVEVYEFV